MSFNSKGLHALASRRVTAILLTSLALYTASLTQGRAYDVTTGDAG
jgi:hypothetical protein